MRISDWSSDVCSSDLATNRSASTSVGRTSDIEQESREDILARSFYPNGRSILFAEQEISDDHRRDRLHCCRSRCRAHDSGRHVILGRFRGNFRSEEHTSELQSLMRISYAVFCLKKKNPSQKVYTSLLLSLLQLSSHYHLSPHTP